MKNKENRIIFWYFLSSTVIGLFSLISRILKSPTSLSNITELSLKGLQLLILSIMMLGCIALMFFFGRTTTDFHITKRISKVSDGFVGVLIILLGGALIGLLGYATNYYESFRIAFFWGILSIVAFLGFLFYCTPACNKNSLSEIILFVIEAFLIIGIQKFLFPIESYWIPVVCGLLIYVLVDWTITKKQLASNIFWVLDNDSLKIKDAVLIIFGPVLISVIISQIFHIYLSFLLPIIWLICILHACSSATLRYFIDHMIMYRSLLNIAGLKSWVLSLLAVSLLYSLAFFSKATYKPVYPLSEGDEITKGIWFTIPAQSSELFPYGYARLEDSLFDDLGKPFFAAMGQTFGLVEQCDPGQGFYLPIFPPNPEIQPKFTYAVFSMCEEWVFSLPDLFWRLGLLGLFCLSFLLGYIVFKDPVDFFLISLLFLFQWFSWPPANLIRAGNVEVLISGLVFLCLVFPIFRSHKYSFIILWGLFSGFQFGFAGFIRQPSGFALLAASIVAVIFSGLKQKRLMLTFFALSSIMVGYNLIQAGTNGLFYYRDMKLLITSPKISTRDHGSGFNLLGGVGGGSPDNVHAYYDNALDITFSDTPIWQNIYNENPMINFTQNANGLMQKTGEKLFFRYVWNHPVEYFRILLSKAFQTGLLLVEFLKKWGLSVFILIIVSLLREFIIRKEHTISRGVLERVKETASILILLVLISALPAIFTSPEYGESINSPAAILAFTLLFLIYYLIRLICSKRLSQ